MNESVNKHTSNPKRMQFIDDCYQKMNTPRQAFPPPFTEEQQQLIKYAIDTTLYVLEERVERDGIEPDNLYYEVIKRPQVRKFPNWQKNTKKT